MSKNEIKSENLFVDSVVILIKNLLIDNPNYKNGYYYNNDRTIFDLIEDTKERSKYILQKIDEMKHLVLDVENN